MTLRRPGYDVPSRNQILEQIEGRFHDRRLIEEFDHQGQIDSEPEEVVRVNLPACAKPCDASEDSDPLHGMPVMQKRQDLPHQAFCVVRDRLRSNRSEP